MAFRNRDTYQRCQIPVHTNDGTSTRECVSYLLKKRWVSVVSAGCTGTDVGPCSPGRAVYTLEQLYLQSMISSKTHAAIEVACADSLAYTQANAECQRLLLLAGKEAGPYDNYNVHDTCGPWSAMQAAYGTFGRFVCTEVGENWPACQRYMLKDNAEKNMSSVPLAARPGERHRYLQEHAPENCALQISHALRENCWMSRPSSFPLAASATAASILW